MKKAVVIVLLLLARVGWASPSLTFAARNGRVTVFAESGLSKTAKELAASAEEALQRIHADLPNLPEPEQIEVRLVREAEDLAAVAPGGRGAPPWAIGVAYPDLGVISVAMRRGALYSDPAATLRHELGHIALGVALGDRAPHWLHEGFAYQHSREWSWERAETLAGMAWLGSIIPIEALDASFPAEELPAHRAYAESYDFVGFLTRRGRYEDTSDDGDRYPFRRFLAEIHRGSDPDTAARTAFGRNLRQLFEEWQQDLTQRYQMMPVGLFGLGLWVLCALLLVLAYWRRRRQNKRRIAQWDVEERERHEAFVMVPPYIPWPGGKDPLEDDLDDESPPGPRLMN